MKTVQMTLDVDAVSKDKFGLLITTQSTGNALELGTGLLFALGF